MRRGGRPGAALEWWWALLAALALIALGLGLRGFAHAGPCRTWWDVVYQSIQLFGVTFVWPVGPVPLELNWARFLAAFVVYSTLLTTVARVFSDRARALRVSVARDHAIVCGLGRRGTELVAALRKRGDRVVVIEADANHEGVPRCRELGALVVHGAASDPWAMRRARVRRARVVLALFAEDGANVEAAVCAGALAGPRCVLQVTDLRLRHLARTWAESALGQGRSETQVINVYEIGARTMLRETTHRFTDIAATDAPALLIVGLGRLGETLLLRAARDWRHDRPAPGQVLGVLVVAPHASADVARLRAEHPFLAGVCAIECRDLNARAPDFARGEFLASSPHAAGLVAAFVCLADEALAVLAADRLDDLLGRHEVPICVGMEQRSGLAQLLRKDDGPRVVSLADIVCDLAVVEDPLREVLAQAIHHEYVRHQRSQGQTPANNPALVPWGDLPEALRASNRAQAENVRRLLAAVGRRAVRAEHVALPLAEFSEAELETMARMEHQRWVDERLRAGWTLGPKKDVERRISPYLVPWERLWTQVQSYDVNAVRMLPVVLAKADYEIR